MSDSRMKHLNNQLIKLKSQIDKFNPSDDISKDEDDMEKIEDLIKDIEGELEEIDNEIEDDEDLKGRKPLLDKLSEQKNELSVLKNNFNKKKDEARSAHSKELLKQGKLTGVERKKAQRDMAIDQVKEVDEQGLMLDSVHDYVKGANKDLENMNVEVKEQGEQIKRIDDQVITIDQKVKKTGNVMSEIERRNCCRKCSLVLAIILLFLINIIMAFLILARYFGWGPIFGKTIKGIALSQDNKIDYKQFIEDYTFIMLKSGTGETKESYFESKFGEVLGGGAKAGTYWVINANNETTANTQASKAADELNNFSQKSKLDYKTYLEITNNEILANTTITSELCQYLKNKGFECGLVLSYEIYSKNYKDKIKTLSNINNYWIKPYDKEYKTGKEDKVALWLLKDKVELNQIKYDVIRAKDNN